MQGRQIEATETELWKLVISITGQIDTVEEHYIRRKLFKLDIKFIEFKKFTKRFLYILGDLGLSKLKKVKASEERHLSLEDFLKVVTESYNFANVGRLKGGILEAIYKKISVKGKLTYSKFLYGFVQKYICEFELTEEEYYVDIDDEEKHPDPCIDDGCCPAPTPICPTLHFKFKDYDLSKEVREKLCRLVGCFDSDHDNEFSPCEVKNALTHLFDATSSEIFDVANRYDLNHDGEVTYEELVSFIVQDYFGIVTIQRFHKENRFSLGCDRKMNQEEFNLVLNDCLGRIGLHPGHSALFDLWSAINPCGTRYISYQLFFVFLDFYFGTHCPYKPDTPVRPDCKSDYEKFMEKYKCMSPKDRFAGMLIDQFKEIFNKFDTNNNGKFERNEIKSLLMNLFSMSYYQADRVLRKFHGCYLSLTYDQFIKEFMTIYFEKTPCGEEIAKDGIPTPYTSLTECQFIKRVIDGCYFVTYKPLVSDLKIIFNDLKGIRQYVFFYQYVVFIKLSISGDCEEEKDDKKDEKWDFNFDKSVKFSHFYWELLRETFNGLKKSSYCRCKPDLKIW